MKTLLFTLYLIFCKNIVFAQEYTELYDIYIFKNSNGITETLKRKVGANVETPFYYYSSRYPKEVELKTNKIDSNLYSYYVTFPNETKVYILKPSLFELECIDPEGSKQLFKHHGRLGSLGIYKASNKNGVFEFLDISIDINGCKADYYTSINKNKIRLVITNIQTAPVCFGSIEYFELQFPNQKNIYKVIFSDTIQMPYLLSTNTLNNEVQRFDWISK
jgi:hypothetical protein